MKFRKEEIQKIVLSVLLLIGLLYCYFALLLGPLSKREAGKKAAIAALDPQITDARKQLQRTNNLEVKAPAAEEVVAQLKATIPEGAPVAWFPPRIADFLRRQGIDRCTTRLTNEFAESELPGFRRLVWAIEIPKVAFGSLGIALAGLENEEPLLQVTKISVEASKDDPQYQYAMLTVATLVKQ